MRDVSSQIRMARSVLTMLLRLGRATNAFHETSSSSIFSHREVEALTRSLRRRLNLSDLLHIYSPSYGARGFSVSQVTVRPQSARFSAVSTSRKTFRPGIPNGRLLDIPLGIVKCPEALCDKRMSRHVLLRHERVRGKAGVIIGLLHHRLVLANGSIHVGNFALIRSFQPHQGSYEYGGNDL